MYPMLWPGHRHMRVEPLYYSYSVYTNSIIIDKKYNYYQLSLSHYEEWVGSKDEATHY